MEAPKQSKALLESHPWIWALGAGFLAGAAAAGYFYLQRIDILNGRIDALKEQQNPPFTILSTNIVINQLGENVVILPRYPKLDRQADFDECVWQMSFIRPDKRAYGKDGLWMKEMAEFVRFDPVNVQARKTVTEDGTRAFVYSSDIEFRQIVAIGLEAGKTVKEGTTPLPFEAKITIWAFGRGQ